eukprot:s642_g5.t1
MVPKQFFVIGALNFFACSDTAWRVLTSSLPAMGEVRAGPEGFRKDECIQPLLSQKVDDLTHEVVSLDESIKQNTAACEELQNIMVEAISAMKDFTSELSDLGKSFNSMAALWKPTPCAGDEANFQTPAQKTRPRSRSPFFRVPSPHAAGTGHRDENDNDSNSNAEG